MTSQGTAHGRFQRAIHRRHVQAAEMAARELGELSTEIPRARFWERRLSAFVE